MRIDDALRLILPIYFILYFVLAFVLKSVMVARRIGKNPLVLPKDDSAYGLVGFYFKLTIFAIFLYILAFTFFPTWDDHFLPIVALDILILKYTGLALLVLALVWTMIAQMNMKDSWRIGIDTETKTELVTTGLFAFSRNPVFFGMLLSMAGLFLTTPNALTGLFFILVYVLIQIQIRLEEDFLAKEHGEKYKQFIKNVRRLI